jgi:hypothetical protein
MTYRNRQARSSAIRKAEKAFIAASRRYLDAVPLHKQAALDVMVEAEAALDEVLSDVLPRGPYKQPTLSGGAQ